MLAIVLLPQFAFADAGAIDAAVVVNYDASTQSSALTAPAGAGGIQKYRIAAQTAVYYVVGADPTANSTGTFLPANTVDYVYVQSGHKIAVVKVATSGLMSINKVK
jgi:endonuclease/exonuclease/phosphatase family metal-dependent hydrolase